MRPDLKNKKNEEQFDIKSQSVEYIERWLKDISLIIYTKAVKNKRPKQNLPSEKYGFKVRCFFEA